jgi:hypothetical protein
VLSGVALQKEEARLQQVKDAKKREMRKAASSRQLKAASEGGDGSGKDAHAR